jgi:hypothetical protein
VCFEMRVECVCLKNLSKVILVEQCVLFYFDNY